MGEGANLVINIGAFLAHSAERVREFLFARSLIPWAAISLGGGIAIYFGLAFEPSPTLLTALAVAAMLALLTAVHSYRRRRSLTFALTMFLFFALAGICRGGWQTIRVAAPTLQKPLYSVDFSGLIERLEPRQGAVRLTLSPITLVGLATAETPKRVRINVKGANVAENYRVGMRVSGRGGFYPPAAPKAPGLADFARLSWFRQVGGYGYSIGAPRVVAVEAPPPELEVLRRHVFERIHSLHPNPAGGIAAALIVGMRGNIPPKVTENIRVSGLAHLLAISGLHLGLVMGGVFFFIRALLAAVPGLALKHDIKKWAVYPSLAAGVFYLLFTGSTIPTLRALVMASIVLAAVLLERTAISIRLLAIAAMAILLWSPESLVQPGFQMSFAATASLIWFYNFFRHKVADIRRRNAARKVGLYFLALSGASLVAWAASSPFAVYHFHRLAVYSLAANLVAVPITAFWVMPSGIVALGLMPLGLDEPFLRLMTAGIGLIIATAERVAALPYSIVELPIMPNFSLLAFTTALGGLFWLSTRRAAIFGVFAIAIGVSVYANRPQPNVIIGLAAVAFRGEDDKGDETWFLIGREKYWKPILLPKTSAKPPKNLNCDPLGCVYGHEQGEIAVSFDNMSLGQDCRTAAVVVIPYSPLKVDCPAPKAVIDRFDLWRDGTHTITLEPFLTIDNVGDSRGARPWHRRRRP